MTADSQDPAQPYVSDDVLARAEILENLLVACATSGGGRGDSGGYRRARDLLLAIPGVSERVPRFLRTCRTLDEFWAFIKQMGNNWASREQFIHAEFEPLKSWLEQGAVSPVEEEGDAILATVDLPHVREAWEKAYDRVRLGDFDGAITAAKTLLEKVCQRILDDLDETYPTDADLPKLHHLVCKRLNLAPSEQTQELFRKLLGGCKTIVDNIAAVRNRLGDAHPEQETGIKADRRHAELAANAAGTAAVFLIASWQEQNRR